MAVPTLDPDHALQRFSLAPHQHQRDTRTEDLFVLCHLGVPRIDAREWRLVIDGLVGRPLTIDLDDLHAYPRSVLTASHVCCGSPFAPFEPTRRVSNVEWGGARLSDLLADCRPLASAKYVWSYGADRGEFGGAEVEAFVKDLPIARVVEDVLIAYELNGAALPPEHGFPVRLVVPGFYGTNSVKWLSKITLAHDRVWSPFTTHWYNDPVLDAAGEETGESLPVWAIAPDSMIVSPGPGALLERGIEHEISGFAWGEGGIARVEVRVSDDACWRAAVLDATSGRTWQHFSLRWTPAHRGPALLNARAQNHEGQRQPLAGRRNAIHGVPVTVT